MRIVKIKITVLILFLCLIAGLVRIQVFKAPLYKKLSHENRIRVVPIKSSRGDIYDVRGRILAKSRLSFNVAVIPSEVKNNPDVLESLADILNTSPLSLKKKLDNNTLNPFTPAVIKENISKDEAILIEEKNLKLKGVMIQTVPLREYVYKESTAHIIGYVGKLNVDELEKLKFYGYRPIDFIGRSGLEKSLNSYLKGKNGGFQIEVDSRGRQIKILGYKEAVRGKDVYLTIDIDLQNYIYTLIKEEKAAVCIWNPHNGKILAMVSSPSFDPNVFINPDSEKNRRIREIFSSNSYPLINRNIQAEYPTGSVFKIVTAMCALETKAIDAKKTLNCTGRLKLGRRTFRCWYESGHGQQAIVEALKNSCNVFFYKLGLRVGVDALSDYAKRFGYGDKTGINLPEEATGLVPDKQWKLKTKNEIWYEGETVNFSIGQGYFLATPLQVLRMISVIANGGNLVYPQIVEKISDIETGIKKPKRLTFLGEHINIVKRGLEMVVSDEGTGARAQVEGVPLAGKTATAQVNSGASHAWFICFFPAENAKFAMVVFLEHGGRGGFEAANLSKKIVTFIKVKYL